MADWTRRSLLKAAAGSGAAGLVPTPARANPLGLPIGCQVYPLRAMLKDFPALVRSLAAIGVTRLELCSPIGYGADFAALADGDEVRKILDDRGMKAESAHFTMGELRRDQGRSIEWAKRVGIGQMVVATLGEGNGGSSPTLDQVKKAAEEYNRIAEAARRAGMQQGLHNEGFEVSTVDGRRTYDRLFDLLDPKLVRFQFQMSTVTSGLVAADYFARYPGRFSSMHLQDIDMNAPAPPGEGQRAGRRPQVPLGRGSIDWPKTFAAARVGGVGSYFVEQSWELTRPSVAYLKSLDA